MMHHDAFPLYEHADNFCMVMGFNKQNLPNPDGFLEDNQIISLGGESIKVLHTPGHANGSICLYNEKNNFVLSGDVLFRQSIGRTDLPGGNYDWLIQSIQSKLFTLPQLTKVFPGHGDVSDIGFEMKNNPFL
jgi:glyoxylase-like metal-dependent hydrolase (beta-lactamase superfamily II)